jgi:hypothetical protein
MTVEDARTITLGEFRLRSATLDDAALVADVDSELHPDDLEDPKMLRHWWSMMDSDEGHRVERWIATRDGAPVGYARWDHPVWEKMPERFNRIGAELVPAIRTPDGLSALYELLEGRSRDEGARKVATWTWEPDELRLGMLRSRGYREERRERFWELDLVTERERIAKMAAESRERMRREGIRIVTLDRDDDPRKWEKLKRMSDEAELDVPTTVPHVLVDMAEWLKWFDSPGLRQDRIWIARDGDDIVGISMLSYPPVRGVVQTDWTGTARTVRGRGVARALKCETLMQAIALGVDRVRTDNDSTNAPILHINETMGYRRRPDMVQHLKEL